MDNYYSILKVSTDAETRTIQSAYRKLARQLHPDQNASEDAHERMVTLNNAYNVLKDPERRAEYDRLIGVAQSQTYRARGVRETRQKKTVDVRADITLQTTLIGHTASVYSLKFNTTGDVIATGSFDNTLKMWKMDSEQAYREFSIRSGSLSIVGFVDDCAPIAAGSGEKTIQVFSFDSSGNCRSVKKKIDWSSCLAFSHDGRILASGSSRAEVHVWKYDCKERSIRFFSHDDSVTALGFSMDDSMLASCDKSVLVWDLKNRRMLHKLTGQRASVVSVAFSNDGKLIAAGTVDKTIRIWRLKDGAMLQGWSAHSDWVEGLAFSPDNRYLASCSGDKTLKIWRVSDAELVGSVKAHTGRIYTIAWSPNGKTIATAGTDRVVRLWNVKFKKR